MGVPVFQINFQQMAQNIVARSTRGVVALLLEDATTSSTNIANYKRAGDVPVSGVWTADNQKYIKIALKGGASAVMAVRVTTTGQTPTADYDATLDTIRGMGWDWCAAPSASTTNVASIVAWIKSERADGYTHKAVVANATAPDSEGIVNFCTSGIQSNIGGETTAADYTTSAYSTYLAGVLAGLPLTQSITGHTFDDITTITESSTAGIDVDGGKFILRWNGESYEVVRGVTSLTTTSTTKPTLFKKIKHVEGCDMLAKDLARIYKTNYKGRVVNSYANKQQLVADFISYFKELTGSVLSPDYDNLAEVDFDNHRAYLLSKGVDVDVMTDIEILRANTDERVYIKCMVQLIDAMEDAYIYIALN